MSNRGTRGTFRVGSLSVDTSGSVLFSADQVKRRVHVIDIAGTGSTGENDTSYDLPSLGLVHSISAVITTAASSGGTLDIGLLASSSGGDADGFMDGVLIESTGQYKGLIATATSGDSGRMVINGSTIGAYFGFASSGSTVAAQPGMAFEREHNIASIVARSVTWTAPGSTTLVGKILVDLTEYSI